MCIILPYPMVTVPPCEKWSGMERTAKNRGTMYDIYSNITATAQHITTCECKQMSHACTDTCMCARYARVVIFRGRFGGGAVDEDDYETLVIMAERGISTQVSHSIFHQPYETRRGLNGTVEDLFTRVTYASVSLGLRPTSATSASRRNEGACIY